MKLLVIFAIGSALLAQPAFEVATVKRGSPDSGYGGGCHGIDSKYDAKSAASAPPLGRCVISDARLGHMLFMAYRLHSMAYIQGGPEWVKAGDDRFDVEAKADDPLKATEQQLLDMLKALLVERFRLKFHEETREVPGFRLVVGRNGPKFKESQTDEVVADWGRNMKPGRGPNRLNARHYSMQQLADFLTVFGDPVIDKTELTGSYDFTLAWDETEGPQLSTALQQQLGLKFEAQKVPQQFIIVESAQKPGAN